MSRGSRSSSRGPATAVACLSGGLDSAAACALYQERHGHIALGLVFDYGQRAAAAEARAARRVARCLGFPVQRVRLPWLARLGQSALTRRDRALPVLPDPARGRGWSPARQRQTAAAVWVPARNVVFLAIAAAFAESLACGAVVAGFNREEAVTFPDNSRPFVRAVTATLRLGTRSHVRVVSPTSRLDKRAIARHLQRLGISRRLLWSCYRGGRRPCGRCESCRRQERAWTSAPRADITAR